MRCWLPSVPTRYAGRAKRKEIYKRTALECIDFESVRLQEFPAYIEVSVERSYSPAKRPFREQQTAALVPYAHFFHGFLESTRVILIIR